MPEKAKTKGDRAAMLGEALGHIRKTSDLLVGSGEFSGDSPTCAALAAAYVEVWRVLDQVEGVPGRSENMGQSASTSPTAKRES